MNSTTFNLLPDYNAFIKTFIELQIIFINSFKRCLTRSREAAKPQSRQVAKEGKEKFLTQRHRENRGLSFRLHLVDHVYLVKKRFTREASKSRRGFASNFLGVFAPLRD
ncbi:MAG: hypothetical protein COA78_37770 [Blastopirellula sp.]|nr:MAG: hypothetical protein COA78_37770 [Blastopirellula sp.]